MIQLDVSEVKDTARLELRSLCERIFSSLDTVGLSAAPNLSLAPEKDQSRQRQEPPPTKDTSTKDSLSVEATTAKLSDRNQCYLCGKMMKQKSLSDHIRLVHGNAKSYPCQNCGKCYKSCGALKKHVLVHTGERPFCCSFCGKTYRFILGQWPLDQLREEMQRKLST